MGLFSDDGNAPLRADASDKITDEERVLSILEKVRTTDPEVQDAIDRGEIDPFGATQEIRNAFSMIAPSEQIFTAFYGVEGVNLKAHMALFRHAGEMERAGLLRALKVNRELIGFNNNQHEEPDLIIPPGTSIGPELAAAALRCKQALRSKE